MAWLINWDNGADACGTFPFKFDSEEDAKAYGDSLTHDHIVDGVWGEDGFCEPVWIDESGDEKDSATEQTIDYFDRYIAGDR